MQKLSPTIGRLVVTLSLTLVGVACGSSSSSPERHTSGGGVFTPSPKNADGTTAKPADPADPAADPATDPPATADCTSPAAGPTAYLFSLSGAQCITPLVRPLEKAPETPADPQNAAYTQLRDIVAQHLTAVMKLPKHAPGRNFAVTISRNDEPNASALNEQVMINDGLFTLATPLSFAMVLCHEVAHSTRNHSALFSKWFTDYSAANKTKLDALTKALNDLITKRLDQSTNQFTVVKADITKIQPLWAAFWADVDTENRRIESEADIVGGQICADAGFTNTQVVSGFTELFQKFKSIEGGDDTSLPDGRYKVTEDTLPDFLSAVFGRQDHPTDEERIAQIARVKAVFVPGTDATIATNWMKLVPPLMKKPAGSALTESLAPGQGWLSRRGAGGIDPVHAYLQDVVTGSR